MPIRSPMSPKPEPRYQKNRLRVSTVIEQIRRLREELQGQIPRRRSRPPLPPPSSFGLTFHLLLVALDFGHLILSACSTSAATRTLVHKKLQLRRRISWPDSKPNDRLLVCINISSVCARWPSSDTAATGRSRIAIVTMTGVRLCWAASSACSLSSRKSSAIQRT